MDYALYVTLHRASYLDVDHKMEQIAKYFAHSCVSFRTCQDDDMQHVIRIKRDYLNVDTCVLRHGLKVRTPNKSNELGFRSICFCPQTDLFRLLVSSFPSRPPSPSVIPWLPDIPTICEMPGTGRETCAAGRLGILAVNPPPPLSPPPSPSTPLPLTLLPHPWVFFSSQPKKTRAVQDLGPLAALGPFWGALARSGALEAVLGPL